MASSNMWEPEILKCRECGKRVCAVYDLEGKQAKGYIEKHYAILFFNLKNRI